MRARRPLIALVAGIALVAAGCSGGPGTQAGEPPIVVGLLTMSDGPLGTFSEIGRAVDAAVRYVNGERGGVKGRPLRVETCMTDGTDDSSAACASQLVAQRPVAVLGGVDLGGDGSMPVFEDAHVPYVGLTPGLASELSSSWSFMLAGGVTADLLAEVDYITGTLHATNVGVVHQDFPGLQSAAVLAAQAILQKRGVTEVKIVPVKAEATADLGPAVRAATVNRPDALLAVFGADGCARVLEAVRSQRFAGKVFLPSSCLDPAVLPHAATLPVTFASGLLPYTAAGDADVGLYLKHVTGPPSTLSQVGFALVVDLYRQLTRSAATGGAKRLTPTALADQMRAARDQPSFMGHPYTCDGQAVTVLPSVCSPWVRLLQPDAGGSGLTDLAGDWVSGADLFKLLTG